MSADSERLDGGVPSELAEEGLQIAAEFGRLQLERERIWEQLDANDVEIERVVDRRIRWRQARDLAERTTRGRP